jgi:hypothetical protein
MLEHMVILIEIDRVLASELEEGNEWATNSILK